MLKIEILDGNPDTGDLQFSVNGVHSPNGNGGAKALERVKWEVREGCNVDYITDINMKDGIPGNTNIFRIDRPGADGGNQKKWKARVDPFPRVGREYSYDIKWQPTRPGSIPVVCDPKISVMPSYTDDSRFREALLVAGVAAAAAAIAAAIYLSLRRKTRIDRYK